MVLKDQVEKVLHMQEDGQLVHSVDVRSSDKALWWAVMQMFYDVQNIVTEQQMYLLPSVEDVGRYRRFLNEKGLYLSPSEEVRRSRRQLFAKKAEEFRFEKKLEKVGRSTMGVGSEGTGRTLFG